MDDKSRRIDCPLPGFEETFVVLPEYWLGEHCVKRDEALIAAKEYKSVEITNFAISLFLVDEFGNVPGIEGDNPKKWRLDKTPLILISWLSEAVIDDFGLAYNVPKNS